MIYMMVLFYIEKIIYEIYLGNWPNYSSNIILELYKYKNEYFVKLLYNQKELKIKNCGTLCPFKKFEEISNHLIPDLKNYTNICME